MSTGTSSMIRLLLRREVQRILMELLNQMDGFDQTVNVKVTLPAVVSGSEIFRPASLADLPTQGLCRIKQFSQQSSPST